MEVLGTLVIPATQELRGIQDTLGRVLAVTRATAVQLALLVFQGAREVADTLVTLA